MKAMQYLRYGGPEVLQFVEVDKPTLQKQQILVQVKAASVNPFDWKVRQGYVPGMPSSFPVTIGSDYSGVVVEVGDEVTDFKVGDEVYGQGGFYNGGTGSFAEFVAADPKKAAQKPGAINFIQAGALPLAGISALQGVEDHIHIQKGQKILIHGGAGGIGSLAIQIAKAHDAYVATTVSAKDREFVQSLGADQVIDYKNEKFEEKVHDFDAVFDTAGGETLERSIVVLKKGGILVSMAGKPNADKANEQGITTIGQGTVGTKERLERLAKHVTDGKVTVQVDKIFPLSEGSKAFSYQETQHPRGKVVVEVTK